MLEACISLRPNGEKPGKLRGDVLVIKLKGSPWGTAERFSRHQCVVAWPIESQADTDIYHKLVEMAKTVSNPSISYPFADFDANGVMTMRSTHALNIAALPSKELEKVTDPTKRIDSVTLEAQYVTKIDRKA